MDGDLMVTWAREQIEARKAAAQRAINVVFRHYLQDTIAQCEAELAILDEHDPARHPFDSPPTRWCPVCITRRHGYPEEWDDDEWPCRTARLLVSSYRHRDGWQGEWAP